MVSVEQIESLVSTVAGKIEHFSNNSLRVVVTCALAAGLSIPIAWFGVLGIYDWWSDVTTSWAYMLKFALVCVSSYTVVALLLILVKAHRKLPHDWLVVVIMGSFILGVVDVWYHLQIWPPPVYEIVTVHLNDVLLRAHWLSLFTLPFAALVKYSGSIVRAVNRWHNGPGYSLSILDQ